MFLTPPNSYINFGEPVVNQFKCISRVLQRISPQNPKFHSEKVRDDFLLMCAPLPRMGWSFGFMVQVLLSIYIQVKSVGLQFYA